MNDYLKELPKLDEAQKDQAVYLLSEIYNDEPICMYDVEPDVLIYILKMVLRDLDQNKIITELMNP